MIAVQFSAVAEPKAVAVGTARTSFCLSVLGIVLAGCGTAAGASGSTPSAAATITKITDGDTVHVSTSTGPDVIRVLGIDSPETVAPGKSVGCGGPQATAFARQMLTGQRVVLTSDPTQADRDRYRRLLRYVRLADGRDYSVEIVRAGWARSYRFEHKPVQEQPQIDAAQGGAQAAERGIWALCPTQ